MCICYVKHVSRIFTYTPDIYGNCYDGNSFIVLWPSRTCISMLSAMRVMVWLSFQINIMNAGLKVEQAYMYMSVEAGIFSKSNVLSCYFLSLILRVQIRLHAAPDCAFWCRRMPQDCSGSLRDRQNSLCNIAQASMRQLRTTPGVVQSRPRLTCAVATG